MQNKHILILTPGFPKDEDDFNCIPPLQEYLIGFKKQFPDSKITVISFQYPFSNQEYRWNSIPVLPMGGKNAKIKKPLLWLKVIKSAKEIYCKNKIDAIHSLWLGECALLGNYLSKKFNCSHICTLMGQDVKSTNKYLKRLIEKEIKFVALSENQANEFHKLTSKKADEIIHWGIDDQPVNNSGREIDFLGVGSLIPLKNYSFLIKTVEEVKKNFPQVSCKIVGAGPELSNLKSMAEQNGLIKNIEFTGLLNRKKIFKLMQRSKIFVHPSTFEGSGYVFAEAIANGMNILSFNVGYAQKHPKWSIANDDKDFIALSQKLLSSNLDFKPINLFPLSETIERYAYIYGIT